MKRIKIGELRIQRSEKSGLCEGSCRDDKEKDSSFYKGKEV